MKILIVDDSLTMRRIVRNSLEQIQLDDILEAGDGAEALRLVARHDDIGLVLSDWHMPVMTGLELVERMQAAPETRHIPMVMVTSEREKTNVIRALSAGARDYLVKPFTPETLKKKIDDILAASRKEDLDAAGSRLMGRIEDMGVAVLVQMIVRTRKSGVLQLDQPNGRFRIFADGGQLLAAEGPASDGEEAFFQAFSAGSGTFSFQAGAKPSHHNITRSLDALLLEAVRRQDT